MKSHRPLQNLTIWVTGPVKPPLDRPDKMCRLLEDFGAVVIHRPVIETCELDDDSNLKSTVRRLGSFGAIVFVSTSGVHFFNRYLDDDLRQLLQECQVFAIGRGTSKYLEDLGVGKILSPDSSDSRSLGKLLATTAEPPVLIVRASRGSRTLAEVLNLADLEYEEVVAYQNRDVEMVALDIIQHLESDIDWLVVTSSAAAQAIVNLYGPYVGDTKVACISEITATLAKKLGLNVCAVAESSSFDSIREAIVNAVGLST